MSRYTWAIDGLGRKSICYRSTVCEGAGIELFCVMPGASVWDCIDILELQDCGRGEAEQ